MGKREAGHDRKTGRNLVGQLAICVDLFVLGLICLLLAPLTNFWWLVLVCGTAVPVTLATLDGTGLLPRRLDDRKAKERELLEALAEHAEITPTAAAMRTSLTVGEASKMLEDSPAKAI